MDSIAPEYERSKGAVMKGHQPWGFRVVYETANFLGAVERFDVWSLEVGFFFVDHQFQH